MKLNAWQMIAALAVLFAAIIAAQKFAPGETATVVAMATTAFGALFLGRKDGGAPPPEESSAQVIQFPSKDKTDEGK